MLFPDLVRKIHGEQSSSTKTGSLLPLLYNDYVIFVSHAICMHVNLLWEFVLAFGMSTNTFEQRFKIPKSPNTKRHKILMMMSSSLPIPKGSHLVRVSLSLLWLVLGIGIRESFKKEKVNSTKYCSLQN